MEDTTENQNDFPGVDFCCATFWPFSSQFSQISEGLESRSHCRLQPRCALRTCKVPRGWARFSGLGCQTPVVRLSFPPQRSSVTHGRSPRAAALTPRASRFAFHRQCHSRERSGTVKLPRRFSDAPCWRKVLHLSAVFDVVARFAMNAATPKGIASALVRSQSRFSFGQLCVHRSAKHDFEKRLLHIVRIPPYNLAPREREREPERERER